MSKLTLKLKNMNLVHYEVGNVRKVTNRPVCALMLCDDNALYKVKVLFKDDLAKKIDSYISSRRELGSITDEIVSLNCSVREMRKDCIVVEDASNVKFHFSVEI